MTAPSEQARHAPIVMIDEPGRQALLVVVVQPMEVGRECSGVVLTDLTISRKHLLVVGHGHTVRVTDLGTTNGSTLDGVPLEPNHLLRTGEIVRFGACTLRLVAEGSADAENESDGIRIYDVPSRTQLGENIPDVDGALGYFSLRPDGLEIAIPYGELGLVLWDLDPQHWLDAACALAGRNLTQQEWDEYLGSFGEYHESCNGDQANP